MVRIYFPGRPIHLIMDQQSRGSGINTIYYNDISSVFTEETFKIKISIDAIDVSLRFKNSEYGIQNFNFHEESGNLVGILGGSGVGKTTLIKCFKRNYQTSER